MGTWLKYISIVGLLSLPITVLGYRLDVFHFGVAFSVLQMLAMLFAAILVASLIVMLISRKKNPKSFSAARVALVVSLIPLLALGSQAYKGRTLPAIHNISTDVSDPPQFNKIVQLRSGNHNPLAYNSDELAEVQQQAYPSIKSLSTKMSVAEAHRKAVAVVAAVGWDLVSENQARGEIEASETTMIWGFTDDVVIRIRGTEAGSVIDLRSVSRIGRSDLGANAARIEKFLQRFSE